MSHAITSQPPATPATSRPRALTVTLWALQALLAVQFAAAWARWPQTKALAGTRKRRPAR